MNDLLLRIHETLSSIESTCSKLQQEESHDYKEIYRAAKLIERHAQQLLLDISKMAADDPSIPSSVKENDKQLLNLVAKATEELMESGEADIQHVADKLAISPSMLRRKLSTATDFSPSNYLLHLRIEFSKRYLVHYPEVTIIDTAYRCGFSDNAYFTKVFHRFTGFTPLQYIKCQFTPPHFVIILYLNRFFFI